MAAPFNSYNDYMDHLFACVNTCLDRYLGEMKVVFASEQGGYKNVLYPDIEVAHDLAREQISRFVANNGADTSGSADDGEQGDDASDAKGADSGDFAEEDAFGFLSSSSDDEDGDEENRKDPDLYMFGGEDDDLSLFSAFGDNDSDSQDEEDEDYGDFSKEDDDNDEEGESSEDLLSLFSAFSDEGDGNTSAGGYEEAAPVLVNPMASQTPVGVIEGIRERAEASREAGIIMPFYELCRKLDFDCFTIFCFVCGILSSTQTDYASIFQVINENGNLSAPTIDSAAKLYFGKSFSVTASYGEMSVCLEQLLPVLDLNVMPGMPFSTVVTPDKRMIDFLFGKDPLRLDENYDRFFKMLTGSGDELNPIMANEGVLEAMKISYGEGVRLFSYCGDEGSGRKFFVKLFCREQDLNAISVNCKKLFVYDYGYVEKAIWAVTRECILTDGCCVLEELQFREEEKEKFFGFMDLFFAKLSKKNITVFANSKEKIEFREVTREPITVLDIPTPTSEEREACWNYFAKDYDLTEECDLFEMTTKFLFTPGKIHDALKHARSLATMAREEKISRANLFKGCNAQMSSELSQKASRVDAKFGFDDIVMNKDQRETITHAIEQMMFRKHVYDQWDYTKKYPYGRGLTVLLFGAPGTGKSMMAQVIAHELNLELYRVDISKVVDKYVGETEKSLSMIFREAKKCNVVLFFDECDTIFAKRSDDGGSNQSSNNNKTALLLQEMEAYDGVCVLATNYKHNIDPAFFRRMKYIVEFQFPNPDTREMLWKTTVPKTTPLSDDVDFRFLAEKFEFAGGNIKNCILNAAFLAAADGDGQEVGMKHYLQAIKYEFVKTGKVFTKADFEPYASLIGL